MLWKYNKVLSSSVDFLPGYADHNVETHTLQQSCFLRALIIVYARPGSKHVTYNIQFLREPFHRSRNLGTELNQDINQDKVTYRTIKN